MLLISAGLALTTPPAAAEADVASGLSVDETLQELIAGNRRFITNSSKNTDFARQIESTRSAQHPHSVFLSCMDSRVPPEIIFDQGIGNIFVIRNAGNVEDKNVLASMEYAVKFAGARLIVVMGHSHCGAVSGAVKGVKSGNLTQLLKQIEPCIPVGVRHDGIVEVTARNNIRRTMHDIVARSSTIKQMLATKQINLVGAFYDIESGKVEFLY
jgi:carbonic anhydrase